MELTRLGKERGQRAHSRHRRQGPAESPVPPRDARLVADFEVVGFKSTVTYSVGDDDVAALLNGALVPSVMDKLRVAMAGNHRLTRLDPADLWCRTGDLIEVDDLLPDVPGRPFENDSERNLKNRWVRAPGGYALLTDQGDVLGHVYRAQRDREQGTGWRVRVEGLPQGQAQGPAALSKTTKPASCSTPPGEARRCCWD